MPPFQFMQHKQKRNITIEVWNCGVLSAYVNPLNAQLNPICHLLAVLGAHHILHVSRLRVKQTPGNETPIDFTALIHTTRLQRLV
jgi:hypothetical protein